MLMGSDWYSVKTLSNANSLLNCIEPGFGTMCATSMQGIPALDQDATSVFIGVWEAESLRA